MRRPWSAFAPHKALDEVFKVIQRANKYIDENAPWALAKDMEANGKRLAHVLYNLLEATRICGILLTPFMPGEHVKSSSPRSAPATACRTWDSAAAWGTSAARPPPSPRARTCSPAWTWTRPWRSWRPPEAAARKAALPAVELEPQLTEKVDFDTFCKSDFRAVKVKACEAVKKSEKLLKFTLDDGTGTDRQILSGIHKFYEPEDLVGKTLVAIVNLPPRKMMGLESQRHADLRRPHRARRGEAAPHHGGRRHSRRRQALLSASVPSPSTPAPPVRAGVCAQGARVKGFLPRTRRGEND